MLQCTTLGVRICARGRRRWGEEEKDAEGDGEHKASIRTAQDPEKEGGGGTEEGIIRAQKQLEEGTQR